MNLKKPRNNKGQAVLELVVLLSLYLFIVFAVFQVSWLLGVRSYVNQQLYKSLFCMAKGYTEVYCKKEIRRKSSFVLFWGEIKNIHLKGDQKKWTGSLEIQPWNIKLKRILQIPEDLLQ
ncbi:MAG: hypothetical protein OXK80_01530 [Bdellovibrionales bacterium]|nr:hypothetical protein [Bdellovibrionales bacterium]